MSWRCRYCSSRRRFPTSIRSPRREWWSFLCSRKCSVSSLMRAVSRATWTSGDPVSLSPRPYFWMTSCFASLVSGMGGNVAEDLIATAQGAYLGLRALAPLGEPQPIKRKPHDALQLAGLGERRQRFAGARNAVGGQRRFLAQRRGGGQARQVPLDRPGACVLEVRPDEALRCVEGIRDVRVAV